ncbi:hypothetical protein A8C75_14175 [Marinobacterium aestuarii]|uniref:Uncharacterized protein n=1 Tax=Marinobacterium aestuarii TaxID=1821621 RepID=A0A1A9EZJ2_9GAMM|nr:hypothetical protein A8C75_14175 [Marinobacterium aestuarii]
MRPDEAFSLRSDAIVRVQAFKVESRNILFLICSSTVPVSPCGPDRTITPVLAGIGPWMAGSQKMQEQFSAQKGECMPF